MPIFRARPNETDAEQWLGTNQATITTKFGAHIAGFTGNPDGSLNLFSTDGRSFTLYLYDWLTLDIVNKLAVIDRVAMWKSYDYVSG